MPPQQENGDDYIRRIATFIRANEKGLAEAAVAPRRRRRATTEGTTSSSILNPLSWGATASSSAPAAPKPVILSIDTHHLFYLLMRMEALGLDIGTLDVQIDSPSRPLSYIEMIHGGDRSDTLSLASFTSSLSAISSLSLGGGWFGRSQPVSVDAELAFIFSSFTKLPALRVTAPSKTIIAELANEPPNTNAIPLDSFRNLQYLECCDVDPRALLGWDRMSDGLHILKIKTSGIEDVADVFVGAVLDDTARKAGSSSRQRRRKILRATSVASFKMPVLQVPETVPEDSSTDEDDLVTPTTEHPHSPPPDMQLPQYKWSLLRQLSLSDNSLTFLPSSPLPYLTSLTHLDLSSNLLVSVPPGLSALYSLVSLNLSDNMIDSVLGIYTNLGQILFVNLSHNRLESICGLERLRALEHIDLRHNHIEEIAEISRLATLPNTKQVWIEGNPFTEFEEQYRVTCFNYFWKENKGIVLDGSPPGFYERSQLAARPPEQMFSSRPTSIAHSPPIVAVGHSHQHHRHESPKSSPASLPVDSGQEGVGATPPLGVGLAKKKKKVKRIVDLDGNGADDSSPGSSIRHTRTKSEGTKKQRPKKDAEPPVPPTSPAPIAPPAEEGTSLLPSPELSASTSPKPRARVSRHSRYQTDVNITPYSPSFSATSESPVPSSISPGSLGDGRRSLNAASKSAARRNRVSASVFESPGSGHGHGNGANGLRDASSRAADGDAFRKKIEDLKREMGDGWLKVYTETQMERT